MNEIFCIVTENIKILNVMWFALRLESSAKIRKFRHQSDYHLLLLMAIADHLNLVKENKFNQLTTLNSCYHGEYDVNKCKCNINVNQIWKWTKDNIVVVQLFVWFMLKNVYSQYSSAEKCFNGKDLALIMYSL